MSAVSSVDPVTVLDCPMRSDVNRYEAATVRAYLVAMLADWWGPESPGAVSRFQQRGDLADALARAGFLDASLNGSYHPESTLFLDAEDWKRVTELVDAAIRHLATTR